MQSAACFLLAVVMSALPQVQTVSTRPVRAPVKGGGGVTAGVVHAAGHDCGKHWAS